MRGLQFVHGGLFIPEEDRMSLQCRSLASLNSPICPAFICTYVHVCTPVKEGTSRGQGRASDPSELEFPAFVVTRCSDSIPQDRAAGALNQQTTF